ncbi:DUF4355 domain-containing protein [Aerococcus urinae]|uniref:capsid assembly scaffolding protein Gp46 family protein n=1 Tax=Aerococcus urinae TaxID=1376 RepID=UPI00254C036B|nr:DUF4355 domain-containing protein [Aerococcus urinae]MDK6688320.1 DUF4355 domain-containing protein [Aerococcus urinae]
MDKEHISMNHEEVDTREEDKNLLTQDEVNKLIAQQKSKAKDEAKKELEKEYQDELQAVKDRYESEREELRGKLGDKDKEEYDFKALSRKYDELKSRLEDSEAKNTALNTQITRAALKDKAIETLTEKGLPVSDKVLAFVVKNNAEDTLQAIDDMDAVLADEKKKYAQTEPPLAGGGFSKPAETLKGLSIFDDARQI